MNYVWFIMYYILCIMCYTLCVVLFHMSLGYELMIYELLWLLYYGLENIALWLLTMDCGKIPMISKRNQIEVEVNSWKPPEWIPSDFYNTFWVNQFSIWVKLKINLVSSLVKWMGISFTLAE
jgi:hypothetical protein